MKSLVAQHIFETCTKCAFLRLIGDNFYCSVCPNKETGWHNLRELQSTHHGIDIGEPQCPGHPGMVPLINVINQISIKANHFSRGLIGFSTGCLYKTELDLANKLKTYLRAGSTAVEISFATPSDLLSFTLTEKALSKLRKFSKITVHAPWQGIVYFDGSGLTDQVVGKIRELTELIPISGVVFHPDVVAKLSGLEVIPLPVLVENMDKRKKFGITAEEIQQIRDNYDLGFVLDLQHAYEHDHSLALAQELILAMGDRVYHLHVSGQTKTSSHAPVYQADNKKEICRLLRIMPSVPVILEGLILEDINATAMREIAYVRENGDPFV